LAGDFPQGHKVPKRQRVTWWGGLDGQNPEKGVAWGKKSVTGEQRGHFAFWQVERTPGGAQNPRKGFWSANGPGRVEGPPRLGPQRGQTKKKTGLTPTRFCR